MALPDPNDTLRITAITATDRVLWTAQQTVDRADGQVVYSQTELVGYDADTLKVVSRRPLGQDVTVTSLAYQDGLVWAATEEGPVLQIDPTGSTDTVSFPHTTQSFVADGTGVWVIEIQEGRVDHITDGGAVDKAITFEQPDSSHVWDDTPQTLFALPGQLWVADYKTGSLWRISVRPAH